MKPQITNLKGSFDIDAWGLFGHCGLGIVN